MTTDRVVFSRRDEFLIARFEGEIDLRNADTIGAQVGDSVPDDAAGLVIDLAGVRYIDSAGVHMLFALVRRLASSRQHAALAVPDTSPLRTLLKITNVNEAAPVATSVDDAIEVLRAEIELA